MLLKERSETFDGMVLRLKRGVRFEEGEEIFLQSMEHFLHHAGNKWVKSILSCSVVVETTRQTRCD